MSSRILRSTRALFLRIAAGAGVIVLAACGGAAAAHAMAGSGTSASVPDGNWTRFDFNAQRSGVGPADTGITRANLSQLRRRVVQLDIEPNLRHPATIWR